MRFIGSKNLMLKNIEYVLDENVKDATSFCDIFSGTASVARYFKNRYQIYSNDLLYFSYVLQRATIQNDSIPEFSSLYRKLGISDPVSYFNCSDVSSYNFDNELCFFYKNYSPSENHEPAYLTSENALRIDYFRLTIESWKEEKLINEDEYYYLVACLVEGIPFVSNISGTYGAFLKSWDKRAFKRFDLVRLDVATNHKNNKCFNSDGNDIIENLEGDILYIDPPYNERQYLPNYHLLETAAKYDYPQIKGVTGLRPYLDEKSKYCNRKEVLNAFKELIGKAKFKHILLSYNTEGLMKPDDIESALKEIGIPETYKLYEFPYRRYKSRSTDFDGELKELIFYVQKNI